ncbi:MAG: glycoside hydrolase family 15 protein [Chthoniobacterales bacterium]
MNTVEQPLAFPPINRHGVIGDRRTGALVAADGTLNWLCVPNFDGTPIFGALLDPVMGGFCRFGPVPARLGQQRYLPETAAVATTWAEDSGDSFSELTDVMTWPSNHRERSLRDSRVIIRRLRAGAEMIHFEICPRWGFTGQSKETRPALGGVVFRFRKGTLAVWTSFPLVVGDEAARAELEDWKDDLWAVIAWNLSLEAWTLERVATAFEEALGYWRNWNATLCIDAAGTLGSRLHRSAMTVHLLTHAEYDCSVAALTTSLPERRGGDRNYDYRFAWVRDASLSLALLARLGKTDEVQHYLDWLCELDSSTDAPLQVCYRIDGEVRLDEIELSAVRGYADSRPVRYGNRAAKQSQLGSLAFFADCACIYVETGGTWEDKHWRLLRRVANYTSANWHLPENGIWELSIQADYVASKVLSWVVLERALHIAKLTGLGVDEDLARWSDAARAIHVEVMKRGWSSKANSFVQRYDSEALDAAVLLIPLMDFLPAEHPKVAGMLQAIERKLMVNGFVYRFQPDATLGGDQLPVGDYEGAFLPATFWYAHVLAKCGRVEEAEAILIKCESIADEVGVFAEEADPGEQIFLGNTPLLFAQVEYARAIRAVAEARNGLKNRTKGTHEKS